MRLLLSRSTARLTPKPTIIVIASSLPSALQRESDSLTLNQRELVVPQFYEPTNQKCLTYSGAVRLELIVLVTVSVTVVKPCTYIQFLVLCP